MVPEMHHCTFYFQDKRIRLLKIRCCGVIVELLKSSLDLGMTSYYHPSSFSIDDQLHV
jgi:hypothetical protein